MREIWYFHNTATPDNMSGMNRPGCFGRALSKYGFHMTVFSASFLHYTHENVITNSAKMHIIEDGTVRYCFVKTPAYNESIFSRISNMIAFYLRLVNDSMTYAGIHGKPEAIIASSPYPLTMVAGIRAAAKLHVPCICEVRDFWPEVIFLGGKANEKSLLGRVLLAGEHWIYKKANALIFLKEGDVNYLTERGWEKEAGGDIDQNKCFYINNGIELDKYRAAPLSNVEDDNDLLDGKFHVVYIGTIRKLNHVDLILDAAKILSVVPQISFLIYGTGDQLQQLRDRIVAESINNVKIKGYLNRQDMPSVLSKASVNLLCYSAAVYNWSRGCSSNKLFEYLASGRPIVSTVKIGYSPIERFNCGLTMSENTPKAMAETIKEIYELPQQDYEKMCRQASLAAKDFDYAFLSEKLMHVINTVVNQG